MQPVGLAPQVPVLLPVRQLGAARVAALLPDHLGHELRRRHVHDVERTEPGAPDGSVELPLHILRGDGFQLLSITLYIHILRILLPQE